MLLVAFSRKYHQVSYLFFISGLVKMIDIFLRISPVLRIAQIPQNIFASCYYIFHCKCNARMKSTPTRG